MRVIVVGNRTQADGGEGGQAVHLLTSHRRCSGPHGLRPGAPTPSGGWYTVGPTRHIPIRQIGTLLYARYFLPKQRLRQ